MNPDVTAVVVTYNPPECGDLLRELAQQCGAVIVVDNGSKDQALTQLKTLCEHVRVELIPLGENLGIAAAQNIGIRHAHKAGARYVLLSDHDSIPSPGMVRTLRDYLDTHEDVAAVGPLVGEDRKGGDQLVYMARKWSPKRATPHELKQDKLDVAFLIASGCLLRLRNLKQIGLMNEALFIDHVDLEWGLRARNTGYRLVVLPSVHLRHSLGDDALVIPGRKQPIHVHAPFRNYYLVRNTILLIKRKNLMPWRWRVRYLYWIVKYSVFNSIFVPPRRERWVMIGYGLVDGLRGISGRDRH